jgi:hypothetical protein
MPKKKRKLKAARREMHPFDVYEQEDGALVVLSAGEDPQDEDANSVWSGEAKDERDAIKQARKSHKRYAKAAAANPEHDPDTPDDTRKLAEEATNKRLGITTRGRKKNAAKSGVRKSGKKRTVKKATKRKTARKNTRRY